jgi:hypothetical protein
MDCKHPWPGAVGNRMFRANALTMQPNFWPVRELSETLAVP